MSDVHRMTVRVRYPECDPGGRAHHGVYLTWFEMGRTELMRGRGQTYADMERTGWFIAVVRADVRYRQPVLYDERVTVETWIEEVRGARLVFGNRVRKEGTGTPAAEATITTALVDAAGRPRRFTDEDIARMTGATP